MYASISTHVRSLNFVFNVSKILGIIPSSKNAIFHKVYAITLAVFFTVASSLPIYSRHKKPGFVVSFVLLGFSLLNAFFLATVNISTVFNTNLLQPNAWTRLNNGFIFVDNKLPSRKLSFLKKPPVQFAIANGVFSISLLHVCYLNWGLDKRLAYDMPIYISTLYSFNVFIVVYSILTVLKNDYENMNDLIASGKDATAVQAVATTLKDMIEDFNALFGWPLVFFAFRGGCQLLGSVYSILVLNALSFSTASMVVANYGHGVLLMLPTILVANFCGRVKAESEKAELLSYKSQNEDVQKLAPFLKSNAAKFSAAGFFDMDRSTISGFLTTTVTYLIVLIQFSDNK